nr:immunoglobulin heavy chain junction region [Homo sapiens]
LCEGPIHHLQRQRQ